MKNILTIVIVVIAALIISQTTWFKNLFVPAVTPPADLPPHPVDENVLQKIIVTSAPNTFVMPRYNGVCQKYVSYLGSTYTLTFHTLNKCVYKKVA